MLRSTEFFRSIECPFYGGGGSSDGDSCNRPYCHFRHRSQKPREKPEGDGQCLTADREHGYDPYNPELPKGSSRNGDGISSEFTESSSSTLELELVNKAIEVVKNEVEQEQKRLLRYEDLLDTEEEYVPSVPSTQKALGKNKSCTEHLPIEDELKNSLEYNPDSYGLNSNVEYTPTPLSVTACFSKYTLDTDDEADAKGNSLKYVPTLMNKPVKYSTSVPSNKYVIDNTKPCTDLEYDPLLNYSARLMSKKRTIKPGTKRPRENSSEAPYTPAGKKRCHRLNSKICEEMEFPDSQGKINDNCPQSQGDTSKFRNAVLCDNKSNEGFPSKAKDLNKRSMKEIAVQYDVDDCRFERKRQENREKQKLKSSRHSSKISRSNKDKLKGKEPKDKKNKGGDLNSSKFKAHNDKVGSTKIKPSHHTQKANKKEKINCEKEIKREKQRETLRHKERNGDDPVDEIKQKGDDKSKTKEEKQKFKNGNSDRKLDKSKMSKSDEVRGENRSKSRSNSLSDSAGKVKCREVKITSIQKSDKNNGTSRSKALVHKNGIHVGSKRKEEIKESKSMKDKTKHPEKTKEKACLTKRTLSHTDLFGDDSSDDESTSKPVAAICCELDSDSDQDVYASTSSSDNEKGQSCVQHSIPSEDEIDFPGLEKEFEFESDPMEECLRIFNESKEVKNEDKGRVSKQVSVESTEDKESSLTTLFPGQKRRISHISKQENVEPAKPIIRPFRRLTAQEVCYQRSLMAQQQAAQLVEAEKIVNTPFRNRGEKRRIAHKPKADVIPSAKQSPVKLKMESLNRTVVSQNCPRNSSLNLRCQTTAGMASKTASTTSQKRIAHTPTLKSSLKRPTIPTEYGSKVPTNVRQRYLNVFIDECLKFCGSEETAFEKALNEEKIVYNRSTSRTVYLNVAVNTLKKLRSQSDAVPSPTKNTVTVRTNKKVQSHEALLGGKLATKTSFTLNRSGKQQDIELTGAMLYKKLSEYVLTEEQLQENCYPRPHPEKPGVAVLYNQDERKNNTDSLIRICCRCGGEYSVSVSGDCIRKEECNYHWGRLRRQKIPGGWETQYSCCAGAVGSAGCQTAKQHVQDGRKEKLGGFMKTFDKEMPLDENPGVFALDCEMCYTKQGLELTRLTVINPDLKVVYDTFVKPDNKVIDYNTRFSGVTEEDMESTTITIRDVQAVLLNMFSAATILIGHSLESDLFALKLIHSTVIDTAVVFPHRLGLPYKRALKNLMADYLKRIIQDNVEGHDSSEDACACMELMLWRLKEDAKLRR